VHQDFAGGHSVDFVFTGKHFKYLSHIPFSGTIKHLQIRVDDNDAYDFSHLKIGVVAAFKLFEKSPPAIIKTLFSENNWVVGSPFADTLLGSKGDDRFIFKYAPTGTNIDTVIDFRHSHDSLYLDNSFFDGLGTSGHLRSTS
jgi:Ca2+-binding RTX toxin-like protein